MVLALAACSASPTETPDAADSLRVVGSNEPIQLNPVYSSTSDAKSWGAIFDPLVGGDISTNEPNDDGLLYGWERSDDLTWVFKVREGVTFHDGQTFDAAAAAFTIQQEKEDPKANIGTFYQLVESATPQDDGTLQIVTKQPYAALPNLLAVTMAVGPDAYTEAGPDGFGTAPVGTGPYVFTSWTPGTALTMTANADYWKGEPEIDTLQVSWSADAQTRAGLVASGQAELALDLTPQSLAGIGTSDEVTVERGPIGARYYMYVDENKGPFADPDLRRAAAMAIDREAIVNSLFGDGGAEVYTSFIGDLLAEMPEISDDLAYDPEAAAKIVASKPSTPFSFTYAAGRSPNDGQISEAIIGMLQAVGFEVTNDPVDFATWRERRVERTLDATGLQLITTFVDPDSELRAWITSGSVSGNCAAEWYDAKNAEALAAPDDETRTAVYTEIEEHIISEDACFIPILKYEGIWAMTPALKGFTMPRIGVPNYAKLSLG